MTCYTTGTRRILEWHETACLLAGTPYTATVHARSRCTVRPNRSQCPDRYFDNLDRSLANNCRNVVACEYSVIHVLALNSRHSAVQARQQDLICLQKTRTGLHFLPSMLGKTPWSSTDLGNFAEQMTPEEEEEEEEIYTYP